MPPRTFVTRPADSRAGLCLQTSAPGLCPPHPRNHRRRLRRVDRRYNKLGVLPLASAAAVAEAKHVFVVDNAKRELA